MLLTVISVTLIGLLFVSLFQCDSEGEDDKVRRSRDILSPKTEANNRLSLIISYLCNRARMPNRYSLNLLPHHLYVNVSNVCKNRTRDRLYAFCVRAGRLISPRNINIIIALFTREIIAYLANDALLSASR